ncbi:MAG: GxxExxY protein [Alphaproteobacteria bacterium PRO2]|nr:GxxExxY protein [Alphaproteobacteria bacterium PRO2]
MSLKVVSTTAATDEITAKPVLDDPHHPLNQISLKIRDSIFKIHRTFGPGLLESAYEECLFYDLIKNYGLRVERQKILPLQFEELTMANAYKVDFLIEDQILLELKACEKITPIHRAQLLTYMKINKSRLGYIVNFNEKLIKNGIHRFVL